MTMGIETEQPIDTLLPRFDQDGEWIDDQVACTDETETILERRDSREIVRRCIERLPEKYRSVLLLRDIEELNTDEAAQSLSVTANAVKVRLHRARQALKTLIEREPASREIRPQTLWTIRIVFVLSHSHRAYKSGQQPRSC
jgi:DNA-directed RNA polymerase specialized sigma24 family protein